MAVVAQKALRPLFLLVVKGEQPEQVSHFHLYLYAKNMLINPFVLNFLANSPRHPPL